MTLSRRNFCKIAAGSAGLFLPGCQNLKLRKSSPHVVVVGGGFGGATAAKYIRKLDARIKVTLIEPKTDYITCPASNWVLGGIRSLPALKFSYRSLSDNYDINVIGDLVTAIDPVKHTVTLSDGNHIHYDRLVLSPGIDFRWQSIEDYDQQATKSIAHAWTAGTQTELLNKQLHTMPDGGTVIICAPPNPYRCPPGPYERASMIAHYLTRYKPRSKILILDPKSKFSKQSLFIKGWQMHYRYGTENSMIEWLSIPDNPVTQVDIKTKTVETDFGDRYQADVLNIIPPQKAGAIAHRAGVTDASGWCPVDHRSGESTIHTDIHIIGDAAIYKPLPKSAFAANSEAKICAFAVVSLLNYQELVDPTWINTCYSLVAPNHGISVAMVYKLNKAGLVIKVKGAGGVTPDSDKNTVYKEAQMAHHWYENITDDTFL